MIKYRKNNKKYDRINKTQIFPPTKVQYQEHKTLVLQITLKIAKSNRKNKKL